MRSFSHIGTRCHAAYTAEAPIPAIPPPYSTAGPISQKPETSQSQDFSAPRAHPPTQAPLPQHPAHRAPVRSPSRPTPSGRLEVEPLISRRRPRRCDRQRFGRQLQALEDAPDRIRLEHGRTVGTIRHPQFQPCRRQGPGVALC